MCWQHFVGARVKRELLTLQAQLEERRQAESVHAVALPAGQQVACTTSTAAVASEPPPSEAVPSCGDVATPLEESVAAAAAAAAAEHMTGATALLAGEPTASPMVLDDLDVVPALRSPAPLTLTPVASSGPAAPVGEDAASPSASLAGFGSPIAPPSSPTAVATTAVVLAVAVLGDEKTELADPDTTLPEEPSTSLHAMAPAGAQESAMPALRSDAMSPLGGTDPDSGNPGPAAVIAASPAVGVGLVGPSADHGDQHAAPPAIHVESGFGSPIATAAPTTVVAATGNHKHLLPCFTAIKQSLLLLTCKFLHSLMTVCRSQACQLNNNKLCHGNLLSVTCSNQPVKGCFDQPQFVILVAVQLQHPKSGPCTS